MTDRGKLMWSATNPKDFSHWGADRIKTRQIPLKPLPPEQRSGPAHFLHCLRSGKPFYKLCTAETGVIAQEILSAGVDSERTGRRINLSARR